jgi:ElaB/YqjD/DUF883 family membrane-anchored ribosome-binding protein
MITNYSSFINSPNLFEISEGVKAKLDLNSFSSIFGNSLFESKEERIILEKAYCTYELGLLYENRKSWFNTNDPIYMLEGDNHNLLFKDNSIFLVSKRSFELLNEQLFGDWEKAWDDVTSSAKNLANKASEVAKDQWNTLSDGAKKAYEFSKRIVSAAAKFVTENPLTCTAIFLQLMSGLTAFIPGVGQIAGPIMLGLAGGLEIYEGVHSIQEAWGKFSNITASNAAKSVEAFKEGGPLVIAGLVSLCLGLNDVITAPKAAVPAAGATSTVLHSAANKWSSTYAAKLAGSSDHFISNVLGKGAGKIATNLQGPVTLFMEKGGSGLAAAAISTLFVTVGKNILGTLFDVFLKSLKTLSDFFTFLISIPEKISGVFDKLIASAESPIAQILITPLKTIINPVLKFVSSLMKNYVKPVIARVSKFVEAILAESKSLQELASQLHISTNPIVKQAVTTINQKDITVTKKDAATVKNLPKVKESLIIKLDSF